VDLSH